MKNKTTPRVRAWVDGELRRCLGSTEWQVAHWKRIEREVCHVPAGISPDQLRKEAVRVVAQMILDAVRDVALFDQRTREPLAMNDEREEVVAWIHGTLREWLNDTANAERCAHVMAAARRNGQEMPTAVMVAIGRAVTKAAGIDIRAQRRGIPFSIN